MRMRKLGQGQTVVFCIPKEIQIKIQAATHCGADIEIADVLAWSVAETHAEMYRNLPLWKAQGERFFWQQGLWQAAQTKKGTTNLDYDSAQNFLEDEARTIEARYHPRAQVDESSNAAEDHADAESGLARIAARCRQFGNVTMDASSLQEEQERELSPEIEQERQIQRVPRAEARTHSLHPDVQAFAETGSIAKKTSAYGPAFALLYNTEVGEQFKDVTKQLRGTARLLATLDFAQTIKTKTLISGSYMRSAQWVLTRYDDKDYTIQRAMLISPYEANELYPIVGKAGNCAMHLYRPRVNSNYAPIDTLDCFTVPPPKHVLTFPRSIAIQLNLFAGQLYFSSHADYLETCKYLGLCTHVITEEQQEQGWEVEADGFIVSDDQGRVGGESNLKASPVPFLRALTTIRRYGNSFAKTHLGALFDGQLFAPEDIEGGAPHE